MKKYYVENGKIVINKYGVKYNVSESTGKMERTSEFLQYVRNEGDLNAVVSELQRKGVLYEVAEIDVSDILKYDGMEVSSEEEARRLIEPALDEVKEDKLKEISDTCRETIYNGVDVTLSDGNVKHFSLETEDQINLNGLMSRVSMGDFKSEKGVPYHADGEMCTLFSIDDFTLVANTATGFILQQTTYCNHLMAYVKGLETREEVEAVTYGQELVGKFLESYLAVTGGDVNE